MNEWDIFAKKLSRLNDLHIMSFSSLHNTNPPLFNKRDEIVHYELLAEKGETILNDIQDIIKGVKTIRQNDAENFASIPSTITAFFTEKLIPRAQEYAKELDGFHARMTGKVHKLPKNGTSTDAKNKPLVSTGGKILNEAIALTPEEGIERFKQYRSRIRQLTRELLENGQDKGSQQGTGR